MKYQVYAALIATVSAGNATVSAGNATVSAGNVADDINDHMPTE
jgi:hypothetical protein|tara:strand:+ start:172 stop:303 length:132 start_codon:yes stop_codon:yes gene_type:complete